MKVPPPIANLTSRIESMKINYFVIVYLIQSTKSMGSHLARLTKDVIQCQSGLVTISLPSWPSNIPSSIQLPSKLMVMTGGRIQIIRDVSANSE